jgi:hypothetical protein
LAPLILQGRVLFTREQEKILPQIHADDRRSEMKDNLRSICANLRQIGFGFLLTALVPRIS